MSILNLMYKIIEFKKNEVESVPQERFDHIVDITYQQQGYVHPMEDLHFVTHWVIYDSIRDPKTILLQFYDLESYNLAKLKVQLAIDNLSKKLDKIIPESL